MARSDCFRLTEYAKTDLLSELNLTVNAKSDCDLINGIRFLKRSWFIMFLRKAGYGAFIHTFGRTFQ